MIVLRFFTLPQNKRFTNKDLIAFMLPVLFEQLMLAGLSMADTVMVSSLGETAVAGVALVNRIDNFAKQFFVALAQGGSVVLAQYIGADDKRLSKVSLKTNIRIVTAIGLAVMLVMVMFKYRILDLLFGKAEADVLAVSGSYFSITAFSYPFTALYYSCSASFRAMGESKVPFIGSIAMMGVNLILKYIFIFQFNMGVPGAALSTLIAMATVGTVLLFVLTNKKNRVQLTGMFKFDFNRSIASRILKVSVPNGIEQGMFQLGALMIAGLVSGLGTSAIAADQIARTLTPLVHSFGSAFATLVMMVVGQCMGAREIEDAEMYTKHILKMDYFATCCDVAVFLLLLKPMLSMFDLSSQAENYATVILLIYTLGSCMFYPSSFAIPSALRGAGDTKFVMMVATLSMFLFRIGAAYILVYAFELGVVGTWVAMVLDWVIRTVIFVIRFAHGKWKQNEVI